jgi:hypothetical protein
MSTGKRIIAILTIAVASVLGLTWATSGQVAKPAERQKWEYKVFSSQGGAGDLEVSGIEGWELVAVVQEHSSSRLVYFKRPKLN